MSSVFDVKAPPPGEAGDYVVPPAGAIPGVLVALIDLGTHDEEFQGKTRSARQVYLVWELTGELIAGKNRNHTIGRSFTLSFHEKAALRQLVERWRGKPFDEPEPRFDLMKLLGQKCLLSIVHKQSRENKTYAKLDTVCLPPKGLHVPPATLPQICWEIGSSAPVPTADWLPRVFGETVLEVVQASKELRGGIPPQTGSAPPASAAPQQEDAVPF